MASSRKRTGYFFVFRALLVRQQNPQVPQIIAGRAGYHGIAQRLKERVSVEAGKLSLRVQAANPRSLDGRTIGNGSGRGSRGRDGGYDRDREAQAFVGAAAPEPEWPVDGLPVGNAPGAQNDLALVASGTEIVTVALRRADISGRGDPFAQQPQELVSPRPGRDRDPQEE